jgi:acid stress-induced BolA-like protein IbaG/YrbA
MNPQQITELIQRGLPGSRATVASEDNVHFEAVVVARVSRDCAPCSAISSCTRRWEP